MITPKHILVAEDSRNDFVLLKAAFASAGLYHDLFLVRDGAEAIAYLKGESRFGHWSNPPIPDLLILGAQMPKSGAFNVLRFLRESPEHRVPAIVMSGSMHPGMIKNSLDLGAAECFDKPIGLQELVRIVQMIHCRWLANPIQQSTNDQPAGVRTHPIYKVLSAWP